MQGQLLLQKINAIEFQWGIGLPDQWFPLWFRAVSRSEILEYPVSYKDLQGPSFSHSKVSGSQEFPG